MKFNALVNKLKRRRKLRGSYRQLADDLGYSHSSMWAWEAGKRNIKLKQFIDWAQSLNFRVELVDEEDDN